jgi:hypothetical protein
MNTAQTIMSNPALGFEIDSLDSDTSNQSTFRVTVREDEDGNPISGFIIVGKNSNEYQTITNSLRQANIQRSSKRSSQIDGSTEEGAAVISKTVVSNEFATAMAVTVGWFGFNAEGAPADFDKVVTEKLLTKFPQWRVRISLALEQDKNFMKV